MSDGGPHGQDPDPTEVFPPLRPDDNPTPPSPLPPVGSQRDPDPTQVMPPTQGDIPTTAVPPTGGPYDPGPPYGGGGGGGGGGGDEPPLEPEPEPWYRQPGPLAALIAGIAAIVVAIIALLVWARNDNHNSTDTLPPVVSTSTSVATATTAAATTTTAAATTTTSSTTTTSTTTTTLPPTTTTTVAPTTTTTVAPTTTTTTTTPPPPPTAPVPVVTIQPGGTLWDGIDGNPALAVFKAVLGCTDLATDVQGGKYQTVLAPTNDAFAAAGITSCSKADKDTLLPIAQRSLVVDRHTAGQIFTMSQVTTEGGPVQVNGDRSLGAGHAKIVVPDVTATDGYLQVLDKIIQQ